ncbi:MAG: hypothetical protein ABWJ99_03080 [Caldimicrobium sp.]
MSLSPDFGEREIRIIVSQILNEELERRISEILEKKIIEKEKSLSEVSLLERVVRVEEELKALREIQIEMMKMVDKRFEALQREMDKRFEAIEKRFEALEKRFDFMQKLIAGGFAFLTLLITLLKLFG